MQNFFRLFSVVWSCGCCSLKTGVLIIAILTLVSGDAHYFMYIIIAAVWPSLFMLFRCTRLLAVVYHKNSLKCLYCCCYLQISATISLIETIVQLTAPPTQNVNVTNKHSNFHQHFEELPRNIYVYMIGPNIVYFAIALCFLYGVIKAKKSRLQLNSMILTANSLFL